MAQTFGSDFILTLQFMARELWWCFTECHAALFYFTSYSDTLLMKRIKTCIVFLEISPWTIQCLRKFYTGESSRFPFRPELALTKISIRGKPQKKVTGSLDARLLTFVANFYSVDHAILWCWVSSKVVPKEFIPLVLSLDASSERQVGAYGVLLLEFTAQIVFLISSWVQKVH